MQSAQKPDPYAGNDFSANEAAVDTISHALGLVSRDLLAARTSPTPDEDTIKKLLGRQRDYRVLRQGFYGGDDDARLKINTDIAGEVRARLEQKLWAERSIDAIPKAEQV